MRKALNENRTVQLAVIGGLALVVVLIFMMNMSGGGSGGGEETGAAQSQTQAESEPEIVSPEDGGDEGASPDGTAPAPTPAMTEAPIGPALPDEVVAAYERGEVIVLLVVSPGGLEDAFVGASLTALAGEPGVKLLVTTTDDVARYARLTQGAGVSRTPALVVVRPRHLAGGKPVAQVHYGLKTPAGVMQAVRDAEYAGEVTTYGPDY